MAYQKGHIPWTAGGSLSPETRAKISATKKANPYRPVCWMKGLTKETDERVEKMAAAKRGKKTGPRPQRKGIRASISTEFKSGLVPEGGFETRFRCGSEHPLWKGGVTTEHEKIRRSRKYKEWRDAVYRRDHYHCQACCKHCERRDIVAHHLNSFAAYEHLRFAVDNGTTLCRSCHIRVHKDEGNKLCSLVI